MRTLLFSAILLGLAWPHVGAAELEERQTLCKVALSADANPIFAEVLVGSTKCLMLVDTGAEMSGLNLARPNLTVAKLGSRRLTTSDGIKRAADIYEAAPMKLQALSVARAPVFLHDFKSLSPILGHDLDGVLGIRELSAGKVFLNYQEKTLEVHSGPWRLEGPRCHQEALDPEAGTPRLKAELGGQPVLFTLDTGATGAVTLESAVFTSLLERGAIELAGTKGTSISAASLSTVRQGWFTKGTLMGKELRGIPVMDGAAKGTGLLGLIWLCGFDLELDFDARQVRYQALAHPTSPVSLIAMTGMVFVFAHGKVYVGGVMPGGRAQQAGLNRDDVIEKFGRLEGAQINLESLAKLVREKAAKALPVRYARGPGSAVEATLSLPALISQWDFPGKTK